jgi:bifunctional UDP-N-acetylglucosamine pyrophosphorylase/glucosamine-1-phosphate N-acetyltransferase
MKSIKVLILAAGFGTRMKSSLPKVLHPLAGKLLLQHVIDAAKSISPDIGVVYGYQGDTVRSSIGDSIQWIYQEQQLGTAHAIAQGLSFFGHSEHVLILLGDAPLITSATLENLVKVTAKNQVGIVTAMVENPHGLGRILRNKKNQMIGIVEEKDATAKQKLIKEINPGIMLLPVKKLKTWLKKIKNKNAQNEYYITDIFSMAAKEKVVIKTVSASFSEEVLGVNTRVQLAQLERVYQRRYAEALMQQGVTLLDPLRLDIRGELHCEEDVTIDVNVIIEGKVNIGRGTKIGANVILKNCTIGRNVLIESNVVIDDANVSDECSIGPFARLRPGTQLAKKVKVGNFVETKKAIVGEGSKLPHLSYIGDADIGKNVNIGAGTITCNYDGVSKHKTIIKDGAFIGSDSQLVAPVVIGEGAYIGAGSTITKEAPAQKLTISRAKQLTVEGWKPPKKEEK